MKTFATLLRCLLITGPVLLLAASCTAGPGDESEDEGLITPDESPGLEEQACCGGNCFCSLKKYDCVSCASGVKGCSTYVCLGGPTGEYECTKCGSCKNYC